MSLTAAEIDIALKADDTFQIPGGHRFHRVGSQWFLTDDSREEYHEIDRTRPIWVPEQRTRFGRHCPGAHIPLVGGNSTPCDYRELLWVAAELHLDIEVDGTDTYRVNVQ